MARTSKRKIRLESQSLAELPDVRPVQTTMEWYLYIRRNSRYDPSAWKSGQ